MQTYTIKHVTRVKHSVSEDVFIDMVRAERPLWDKKDRDYKNLELKAQLWNSIAEKCNTTGKESLIQVVKRNQKSKLTLDLK